jgi:hypothetical protein
MTIFVFSLAVSNVKRDGSDHFDNGHSRMGLAMLVLCLHQALGGILRPSKNVPSSSSHDDDVRDVVLDEDGIANEAVDVGAGRQGTMPIKSMTRQAWELLHKSLGLSLFFLGTWQLHEGMTLYHERYNTSSYILVVGSYVAWMGIWIVVIIGGILYRWRLLSNSGGSSGTDDNSEKKMDSEMEMSETSDAEEHVFL